VLRFRGWISGFFGLLICVLACSSVAARQDQPVLRLLVLGADDRLIQPAKRSGVDDAAVPALATPQARRVTGAFIGQPINEALLTDIKDRLLDYYVSIGRPFVSVNIPAQDAAAGALRVNVFEIKRGTLRVEGNRWFDAQQYLGAIRTSAGDPIDTRSLAEDANWINRDDSRHATIAVEPGDDPSTYNLVVRARDSLPLNLTVAADNTGTRETGLYRIGLGVEWTNAFWRGDDFSYGLLTSPDQFRLIEHALTYTAYLPWRDSITVSAVNAVASGRPTEPGDGSSVNGHDDIISFRYNLLLPSSFGFGQQIDLGYDFKSTNNNVLTGGNTVFPTTSELDQFVLAYSLRRNDPAGVTGVTALLVGSPGHLTTRNTDFALGEQQADASSSYVYSRLTVERLTNLPLETSWSVRLTAQYSSANLLPSEQLVFGGIRSIRGFVELGATRDQGVLMQNDFRLEPVKFDWPGFRSDAATLVPFVFLDLGAGRNHLDPADAQRSWIEMVSTGPGITLQLAPYAALRLSWGFPLIRNGHTGPFLGPQFGTQITF
jgi:hemolysin activation/secretion protein